MPISQRLRKMIKSLHQKQFRDQNGLFVAEGEKLVTELLGSEYLPEVVVVKDSPAADIVGILDKYSDIGIPVYTAPKHQFDQLCDTKTPQKILAVVNQKDQAIMPGEPFIALDGVSDPGNVGTIIRSAEWFGFKQVILGRDTADIYNPKTVRSTMGAIFKVQAITAPNLSEAIVESFKGYKIYAADVEGEKDLGSMKPASKFGIIFGSEAHGLSEQLNTVIDERFSIPGYGSSESLNVSVAAGITLYHFAAKRKIK